MYVVIVEHRSYKITHYMAIKDYLKYLNPFNIGKRGYYWNNDGNLKYSVPSPNASGIPVDAQLSLQFSAVWAAVRIISESIASLPINIVEEFANGEKLRIKSHPLYSLLNYAPNKIMTPFGFFETNLLSLCLYGNSYSKIIRDGSGRPISLEFLHPSNIEIKSYDGDIYYHRTDTEDEMYLASEIIHFVGLSNDGIHGISPIEKARENIGLGLAAQKFGARFFNSGGQPSGSLSTDKTLSAEAVERLRASFNNRYAGVGNTQQTIVLEEGLEFKPISIPPDQAQFLATRTFSIQEIARIFRVPPHLLADLTKSSFNNIVEQELEFVTHTIRPYIVRIEQELERKLLLSTERNRFSLKFNLEALLRADPKTRSEFYRSMVSNGIMTINEVRAKEDLNPIEGGNQNLVQLNMTDINNLSNRDNN